MSAEAWALVAAQHGVIAHRQLRDIGYSREAIKHRRRTRRLFPLFRGVYAVGRPEVSRDGLLMAATLACGDDSFISHSTAAGFWTIRADHSRFIHVSSPKDRKSRGIIETTSAPR